MIQNILVEASRGEVVLTSRPRVIALPPLSVPRLGGPGQRPLEGREGLQGRAGSAGSLSPTPATWSFLSSRILTPDSLPAASPGPQQAEMPGSTEPPPTNCLQTPAPTPSDLQL